MKSILVALALAGSLAVPGLAQAMDDMSCADFTAMDSQGQMDAIASMEGGMAADGMMAGDAMASDDMTMAVATACTEHPDMMVGEAMKGAAGH